MCLGLGYFFNLYRGRPLVREGGVLIMSHPTTPEFHPVHHPSYIDFFEEVLAETTDPRRDASSATSAATRPTSGTGTCTAPATRTTASTRSTCGTGEAHALEHLGAVIVVGGDPATVRRLGFRPASTLADALEMATDVVGARPSITYFKNPPLMMADVT